MTAEMEVVTVRCAFCQTRQEKMLVHGRAQSYCRCGSNNLVLPDGTFVGPEAKR